MNQTTEKEKVLLGMSGGTDSSVAAMLLQDAGYEVTGITFRFYEKDGDTLYLEDARNLADSLGIKHITFDAREEFRHRIIDYFIAEYLAGRTPVPCTLCNNYLKWPLLASTADKYNIPHIATGHYVRKQLAKGAYYITCGKDQDKDQSFFLWGLPQHILSRMILPMGEITKKEAKVLAEKRGFLPVARKKESMSICFSPMDYRSFLRKEVPSEQIKKGDFVDETGCYLGRHEGVPFYTIGQRRGLGIQINRPVFVKEIDPINNRIILSDFDSLNKQEIVLKDWNLINPEETLNNENVIVKIRYRNQATPCRVTLLPDGNLHVKLLSPLGSIACGQAAAFYLNERVLGGGIISQSY